MKLILLLLCTYSIKINISSFIFFNPLLSGNFYPLLKVHLVCCFFFSACCVPFGHKAIFIHGFVEELVVNDDPEYQWIDKIRTPRSSNEARQRLFTKLSGFLSHLFFYLLFIFLLQYFFIGQVKLSFIHSQPMSCNHGESLIYLSAVVCLKLHRHLFLKLILFYILTSSVGYKY